MRPPIHFDGEPDRFARVKALFPKTCTAQIKYPTADPQKVTIRRPLIQALAQWRKRWAA